MSAASSARALINTAEQGKDTPSRDKRSARQIAHRLINVRGFEQAGSRTLAHAAVDACNQLHQDLSRWVGLDGCHALFTRALAQARSDYPLLEEIQLRPRSEPYVEGGTEAIDTYGAAQTAEAIESMLAGLIELLGRLIGDDMAMKLIEESFPESAGDDSLSSSRRTEA
ncbi:MAG: hypothetical protein M3Z54_11520 [Gemmatimonadota bacterium]|nr:hypothetical protein [Gemmatimonadota bacterium]